MTKLKEIKDYCLYNIGAIASYVTVAITAVVVGGICYCIGVETGIERK